MGKGGEENGGKKGEKEIKGGEKREEEGLRE